MNATITLNLIFVPGPGYTNEEVRQWLADNADNDLCEISYNSMSICDETEFSALTFSFTLRQAGRQLRATLTGGARAGSDRVPVQTRGIEASLPSLDSLGVLNFEMVGDMPMV
jgi:hypothetical protein